MYENIEKSLSLLSCKCEDNIHWENDAWLYFSTPGWHTCKREESNSLLNIFTQKQLIEKKLSLSCRGI